MSQRPLHAKIVMKQEVTDESRPERLECPGSRSNSPSAHIVVAPAKEASLYDA
ncbi:MAG: hypothetical protein KDK37_00230 [Leptospiraceae bacterium]|nr:hypothetical protein [Leptospiraceae bacterium]MCB1302668.1 hypothetical protein [Leptospiraceae bacterium]